MTLHLIGLFGLLLCFVVCTLRPINLGAMSLAMTFVVGALFAGEDVPRMLSGFPVDMFVLLVGVTYLFGVAAANGTLDRLVSSGTHLLRGRRRLLPWGVFLIAALPALCGSLGSAGVALLAPLALRLARLHGIDGRLVGLMLVHGAAAGNFSPLNVLSVLVQQAAARGGHAIGASSLFVANLAYNLALAVAIQALFGGWRRERATSAPNVTGASAPTAGEPPPLGLEHWVTLAAIAGTALVVLAFRVNVGLAAFVAAALIQVLFPRPLARAEERIAWGVVLLVCGVVTYVAALERYGAVAAAGAAIARVGSPSSAALLILTLAAVTSAFASSAGILGALTPLAMPLLARGDIDAHGLMSALALSATVVDATPFSTVGALVVASAEPEERPGLYRGLLWWGAAMVVTAPPLTWMLFVVPGIARGEP